MLEARASCQANTPAPYNGDLASVPDQATNDFLTTLTTDLVWIGGNDIDTEGTWVWSDGTPWNYDSWRPGEPTNTNGEEDGLVLNYGETGLWNDLSVDGALCSDCPVPGYICQHKIDNGNDTWRLVKVNSETATTTYDLYSAIMSGADVAGQTEVLYRPGVKGWHEDSVYSWTVRYDT